MNLVILFGGNSKENKVSLSSAKEIKTNLEQGGHLAVLIDLLGDYSKFDYIANYKELYKEIGNKHISDVIDTSTNDIGLGVLKLCQLADIVFLATHGGIGENGKLQAVLEIENISYTGNGFFSTAISMDKDISKRVVESYGLLTPKRFEDIDSVNDDDFPLVVKPNEGGSSIGVQICQNREEVRRFLNNSDNTDMIVEQFISGREFSVGVVGSLVLPPIEIVVEHGFYDYDSKYMPGLIKEIVPADIDNELDRELREVAFKIHQILGLEVYSRTDVIVDAENNIFFIETNAIPGMTPTSLLPQEAKALGINFSELCDRIVKLSLNL